MTTFALIRHGTCAHVGRFLPGRMPGIHLNETGQRETRGLIQRLFHFPVTAIHSSPLERATETATPLADHLGLSVQLNDAFIEVDFGEWTGMPFDSLPPEEKKKRFDSYCQGTRIPGGETITEVQTRAVNGLKKLTLNHPQDTLVIVTHADVIKAILSHVHSVPLVQALKMEVLPASMTTVDLPH